MPRSFKRARLEATTNAWEQVDISTGAQFTTWTMRLSVPGGWLYRVSTLKNTGAEEPPVINMTFVKLRS